MRIDGLKSKQMRLIYLKGVCGLNEMDSNSNKDAYGSVGMSIRHERISNIRLFDPLRKMEENEIIKRIDISNGDVKDVKRSYNT